MESVIESGRVGRAGRAAVFAAACVLLGAAGHVLMSGDTVPGRVLAAAFGAVGALGWLTARRERGPLLVTGLTVGVQAALHALFSLGQAASGGNAAAGADGTAAQWVRLLLCNGHPLPPGEAARLVADAGLDLASLGPPADAVAALVVPAATAGAHAHAHAGGHLHAAMAGGPSAPMGGGGLGMLAAHLVAALLLGLWLAAGERAVFRLGRTVAAWLFAPVLLLLRAAAPVPPLRPRRRPDPAPRLRRLLLVHAITSRGPPLGTAVL
ncbi:hypothetical protein ACIA8O_06515 [Kitasatospora sp. NPDC051853]|uniref:hypothetical protein n=1 Tax=Kitasatospora sp. NPDC051853 TaxID=3364058 RepID=UPI0037A9774E